MLFWACKSSSMYARQFLMNEDGTASVQLAEGWGRFARFSDDGSKIVYFENQNAGTIRIMNTADLTGHLIDVNVHIGRADFSPDGTKIIYDGPGLGNLYTVNTDGTAIDAITSTGDISSLCEWGLMAQ